MTSIMSMVSNAQQTEKLGVRDSEDRTNNGVESFHATFHRRVLVSHPNTTVFITHLQNAIPHVDIA
jgi:hypothetical protein